MQISDLTEKTEPPPLTQREMNQFITLAALPTLERALERLRWLEAQRAGLTNPTTIMVRIDEGWITPSDAVREITRLRADLATRTAEVAKATAERDEAQLKLQRIRCEISCRVEHGADSNGHLEGILAMLKKEGQR
jgi:hypothetical protein